MHFGSNLGAILAPFWEVLGAWGRLGGDLGPTLEPYEQILGSSKKRQEKHVKKIKNGCYCTFECAMSSSILFNPNYLTRIAVKAAGQKLNLYN